ncbi:hypothetical protein [Pasteurella multocida]|nr:hypothetical protein [Pasteurella multocida]
MNKYKAKQEVGVCGKEKEWKVKLMKAKWKKERRLEIGNTAVNKM